MLVILTILTFFSTFTGGLLALSFRDKLHLITGFSAGTVIGVCFFDLLPEALSLGSRFYQSNTTLTLVVAGFLFYMVLDRLMVLHLPFRQRQHAKAGTLAAGSFSLHSFFDGFTIGMAFKVSESAGIFVALAVIVHAISDGMNTITVLLKREEKRATAFKWLLLNSIAPLLGVIISLYIRIPERSFVLLISLFTGFFLYIGASDLLPESQHKHPSFWTTCSTILGTAVIYTATQILNS